MNKLLVAVSLILVLVGCAPAPAQTPEWEVDLQELHGAHLSPRTTKVEGLFAIQDEYGYRLWKLDEDVVICLRDREQLMVELSRDARHSLGEGRYLVARGRMSQRGDFGHLNTCDYMFALSEVVEYRRLTPAEVVERRRLWPLECAPGRTLNSEAYRCE